MRVVAEGAADAPVCRLASEALGVVIGVTGLSATELRYRLEGQGRAWRWADLANRGPITLELISEPAHPTIAGDPVVYQRNLSDGLISLISGGAGRFEVRPEHEDPGSLLPASFHAVFAQQLARAGVFTLHATGIVTPTGSLLAVGRKGAGKSTLAASALGAGFGVVSDDWLIARPVDGAIRVARMRNFMMLRDGWATRQLQGHLPSELLRIPGPRPRSQFRLPERHPLFPESADAGLICVLERPRGGRRSRTQIEPMPAAQALARLTESSMPILLTDKMPVERECLFRRQMQMINTVPCRLLVTGIDLVESPDTAWSALFTQNSKD